MKQLSEFKNEDGVKVVAKLLNPIGRIVLAMKDNKDNKDKEGKPKNRVEFLSQALEECPKDVIEIFAILSETDAEKYECNAASLLMDTITLAADTEFMELFGLQSQTPTSSGSASENTEARQD